MVRHLVDTEVGHVGHDDPELGGRCDLDVVEADPVTGDGQAPGCVGQHPGGDRLPVGQDGVGARGQLRELVVVPGLGQDDLRIGRSEDLAFGIEARPRVVGDEHAPWHRRSSGSPARLCGLRTGSPDCIRAMVRARPGAVPRLGECAAPGNSPPRWNARLARYSRMRPLEGPNALRRETF